MTNLNKSIIAPIKVKLYHKADWDSINSSLSNQLTILQDQILDLLSSENADSINIINNAAIILTDSILNIYNTLPEKTIKPNTSLPFDNQLLIKQKREIKRAFIKTRNPFPKTVLNVISKKIKQQIKNYRTADTQNRSQSLQLNNDPKSWRTLKIKMGYPSKGSSYPDLTNGTKIAKTNGHKLKVFPEHLKSIFATKVDLKDKNVEGEIRNFLILNVQDYSLLKSVYDHEDFISINELDRIIKNLDNKKAPGLDSINNKLTKSLKPALLKFLHFFFNLCINFGIHPANWKIAKVIMLHKAGKPEDLAGSYRSLSLTSCLVKLLEKAVADNLSSWAEANKKFKKQQNVFRKNRSANENLFQPFETIKLGFCTGHPTSGIFLDVEKTFDQVWYDGLLFKLTLMCLNRKLIRRISNFLYHRKLIISINEQLCDPITSIHGVAQGSPLSPILFILYVSDIPQALDVQVNLSQFPDDIAIWAQAPVIRSINLSYKNT